MVFCASSWWTPNTSSLTGARGRAWVDVLAPPNTSCGLLSTGSSDWEQTLWLGKARRPFCPTVANGWWHHCTLGLGCLVAQNFPMDDAHSEGVHNRLGPDISWRPALPHDGYPSTPTGGRLDDNRDGAKDGLGSRYSTVQKNPHKVCVWCPESFGSGRSAHCRPTIPFIWERVRQASSGVLLVCADGRQRH